MHERKTKMNELSDGVITLSGGYGTLERVLRDAYMGTTGITPKADRILNINGFYDELLAFVQTMVNKGFSEICQSGHAISR